MPTISYPGVDLPVGEGRNSTYSGLGIYTINAQNIITVGAGSSYSYLLGSGFFGVRSGTVNLPTITYLAVSIRGGYNVATYTGEGLYTLSPGNILSINPNGGLSWISGGLFAAITPAPNSLSGLTATIRVTSKFPFFVPDFSGHGILSPGNVIQVNPDGSYIFLTGGPPPTIVNLNSVSVSTTSAPTGFVFPQSELAKSQFAYCHFC